MFQRQFTKPLPKGAKILDAKRASVPSRGGGRRIVQINPEGRMICWSKAWYTRVNGKITPLMPEKDAAKEMAAHLELDARRVARGLEPVLPQIQAQEMNLAELLQQWVDDQTIAGRHQVRIAVDKARVAWLLNNSGLASIADLSKPTAGEAIQKALDTRKAEGTAKTLPKGDEFNANELRTILGISGSAVWKAARMAGIVGEVQGPGLPRLYTRAEALKLLATRKATISPVTLNGYRVSFGSFCRWLNRKGLLARVPYLGQKSDEKKDRRLVRRALSWSECQRLAEVTKSQGVVRGNMSALDRAVFYKVAFTSLLRRRALAELVPGDCHLDGDSPWLSVRGETDKTGASRSIPIPKAVAAKLAEILVGRAKNKPIWAMPSNMAGILRADLKAADIPYRTSEGVLDLHAMRHSGISHLVANGVNPVVVAKLAGHSDVKQVLQRYGHLSPANLADLTRGAW